MGRGDEASIAAQVVVCVSHWSAIVARKWKRAATGMPALQLVRNLRLISPCDLNTLHTHFSPLSHDTGYVHLGDDGGDEGSSPHTGSPASVSEAAAAAAAISEPSSDFDSDPEGWEPLREEVPDEDEVQQALDTASNGEQGTRLLPRTVTLPTLKFGAPRFQTTQILAFLAQ